MDLVTLDKFGRVLIPKKVREQLGLAIATQLALEVIDGKLMLVPVSQVPKVYHEGGVLVVEAEPTGDLETAINELREERIAQLAQW